MRHLFPEQSGLGKSEEILVEEAVHHHTELASKLHNNVSELQKSKNKLLGVRKDRAAVQYQCRELMAKLEDLKFEDDNPIDTKDQEQESSPDRYCLHIIDS